MKEIIEKLKVALGDIEITEEATVALKDFFEEHTKNIQATASAELEKYKADCEAAFDLFEADCEKAFDLFEADCESAFGLFEADCEKAFDLFESDTQEEFTKNMASAIEEIYNDVAEKAKEEFLESDEFKVLNKIKNIIIPMVESESSSLLRERIEELESELGSINEEKVKLEKDKLIDTLIEDLPKKYAGIIRPFIEKADSHQGIYDRYDTILEMLEMDILNSENIAKSEKSFKRKVETEPEKKIATPVVEDTIEPEVKTEPTKKDKIDKTITQPVLESITTDTVTKEKAELFSKAEKEILATAGLI